MVFKSLIIFLLLLIVSIKCSETDKIKYDELDIKIDVSNLIAEFDEKINYNLKVKDNDVNVQQIEKILPDLDDNKFFDLKVTSEKADIIKFEIIEVKDIHDSNKKKKILLVEYKLKKNPTLEFNSKIEDKNFNFTTDIDFCICFKTKDFEVVRNKIFLRDVPFSNLDKNDENLTLKINLYNLPGNSDIKKLDISKRDIDKTPIKPRFNPNNVHQNGNNHKIRFDQNKNLKQNKKNEYSVKYDEKFHKDSISFLSINLTIMNKSSFNQTINHKKNVTTINIKNEQNLKFNNTAVNEVYTSKINEDELNERLNKLILDNQINADEENNLNKNEKFYFFIETSALIFVVAIIILFSLINIFITKDKDYY